MARGVRARLVRPRWGRGLGQEAGLACGSRVHTASVAWAVCCQPLGAQMASALKHIHDLGLAHLDLKPDNIYRARPQHPAQQAQQQQWAGGGGGAWPQQPALQPALSCSLPSSSSSLQQQPLQPGQHHSSSSLASSSAAQPMAGVVAAGAPLGAAGSQPPGPASQPGSQPGSQGAGASSSPRVVYKLGDFGLATSKHAPAPVTEGDARCVRAHACVMCVMCVCVCVMCVCHAPDGEGRREGRRPSARGVARQAHLVPM